MANPVVNAAIRRLVQAGFPEGTARKIATGELSMDPAAKAARMSDQGFQENYFKGMYPYDWRQETTTSLGPEITEINRQTPFPSFGGEDGDVSGIAGFLTQDPALASQFAAGGGARGAVYPLSYRAGKTLEIDAKGKPAGSVQFGEEGKPFRDAVRSGEYDTILISNTSDEGDVLVALRPENIRSRFAAFDPDELDNPNILAGLGAAGVGAGLMAPEEAEAAGLASLLRMGFPESTARKIVSGELSMDTASRMARAREQGFDYTRATRDPASPLQPDSVNYAMFKESRFGDLEGDLDSLSGYGPFGFASRGDDAIDVEQIQPDIVRAIRRRGLQEDYGTTAAALAREAAPEDILTSAGLFDAPDLVEAIFEDVLKPQGISAIRTPDGLIRFPDESGKFTNTRSIEAAFDPDQVDSPNLMAGIGAGAVGVGLMAPEEAAAASPLERPEAAERRANARAVAVASDTLERLRRERGAVASPLDDTGVYRLGAYLTENRPSEMDPVQRALQSLGMFQGIGEYLRTTGEGQRTTTMQDINAALDIVPL